MAIKKRVVIIGNGAAGNSAAETIRRVDEEAQITIFSHEPFLEYSACVLPDYIAGEVKREKVFIKDKSDYRTKKIELILNRKVEAIETDNKIIYLTHKKVPYDQIILATGSIPSIPPIKGIETVKAHTLKTFADTEKLINLKKANCSLIIGGGVIGIELAIALRKRNCEVSIVEIENSILPRTFSSQMSARIKRILEVQGIKIFVGERVLELKQKNDAVYATTDKHKLKCDSLIITTGFKPNVKLAKCAGVTIGSLGGILTNQKMSTNILDVFACGDCIESKDIITGEKVLSMLWGNAILQGKTAGLNCMDYQKDYAGSFNLVGLDLFDLKALSMGKIANNQAEENSMVILNEKRDNLISSFYFINDKFVGFELLGNIKKTGKLIQRILKRTPVDEFKALLKNRGKSFHKGPLIYTGYESV